MLLQKKVFHIFMLFFFFNHHHITIHFSKLTCFLLTHFFTCLFFAFLPSTKNRSHGFIDQYNTKVSKAKELTWNIFLTSSFWFFVIFPFCDTPKKKLIIILHNIIHVMMHIISYALKWILLLRFLWKPFLYTKKKHCTVFM